MICQRCKERGIEIEMEYKGEVSLRGGKLVITYAESHKARRCLEELIGYEPRRKKKEKIKKIKKIKKPKQQRFDGQVCMFGM